MTEEKVMTCRVCSKASTVSYKQQSYCEECFANHPDVLANVEKLKGTALAFARAHNGEEICGTRLWSIPIRRKYAEAAGLDVSDLSDEEFEARYTSTNFAKKVEEINKPRRRQYSSPPPDDSYLIHEQERLAGERERRLRDEATISKLISKPIDWDG